MNNTDSNINIKGILNPQLLISNIGYIMFLAFLCLAYIYNHHAAEKKIRETNQLNKEIKELRWYYIATKSDLTQRTKLSEISKAIEPFGLKSPTRAPQKLIIEPVNPNTK
jgi:hypothetical protein